MHGRNPPVLESFIAAAPRGTGCDSRTNGGRSFPRCAGCPSKNLIGPGQYEELPRRLPRSLRFAADATELRHLPAFLAVADQGSANRAGAALFRAQSAVPRSIHKLERELGVELFERRARGRLLTEHGVDTASVARRNR
jgi:hypothetical protein